MPDYDGLLSAIDSYDGQAYGSDEGGGELSRQRALALDAFQGKNIEPAPEGRSQVTDWAVFEVIQSILPSLIRIFAGGDDIVEFKPLGPDDEEAAEQESQVLNYLVTQKNNWFLTCLEWFQDALLTKNAYCMVSMEEKIVPEIERYERQSEEQVAMILDDDVEVVSSEQYDDPDDEGQIIDPMSGQPIDPNDQVTLLGAMSVYQASGQEPQRQFRQLFDIEVRRTKATQKLRFDVLPPERCRVGEDTPDFTLEDCNYFEYFNDMTVSDVRKCGYDIEDDVGADDSGMLESVEDTARDDIYAQRFGGIESTDPSMRTVRVRSIWIRHDYDQDGIAELQKVVLIGREVIDYEPATRIPVSCIVPFMNTHRHMGMSVADLVFDIQRIKTAMLRSGLDSLYLATNPRHYVNEERSNENTLRDLLVSRPGGIVRGSGIPGETVMPLPTENTFQYSQAGLQHMDSVIESRVGVSKFFSGIDKSDFSTNNAHDAIGQLSTMASQRVEQIARIFGNGVERLFSLAHELVIKSGHSMDAIKLRGQWVEIDPTTWRTGRDMRVTAPFAAGNKDSLLKRLMLVAQIQEKALAGGLPITDAANAYNLALEIASAADVQGSKFFTDPDTVPPKEPPPDYTMLALEVENKKADNQAQDSQVDAQVKIKEIDTEAEIKRFTAQLNSETQLALAQIKAGQVVDLERFKAQLKNAPVEMSNDLLSAQSDAVEALSKAMSESLQAVSDAVAEIKATSEAPIKIVRKNGKIVGKEVNGKLIPLEDA